MFRQQLYNIRVSLGQRQPEGGPTFVVFSTYTRVMLEQHTYNLDLPIFCRSM